MIYKFKRSYWYNEYNEKIKKATSSEELEKLLDDIDGDFEAGNLSEEEKEVLICSISDQEGEILLKGGF